MRPWCDGDPVTHFMDEAERLCDASARSLTMGLSGRWTRRRRLPHKAGQQGAFCPFATGKRRDPLAIPGVNEIERKERYVSITGTGDFREL